tara:strand:+ start:350 stop:553 length:204 start_codon:yes stop_codon:yes gene_type:complete
MDMSGKHSSTTLVSTGGGSRSLRTTVPMWIVEHFNLGAGDNVDWRFTIQEGQIVVVMTPTHTQVVVE